MRKKHIYIILLLTLFSCNKKQPDEKPFINSQNFFARITDISKFKNTEKTKLNDSTYKIKGIIDSLQVVGHLTQNNEKIDWWNIVDLNNNKNAAIIEYRIVDNKEFANQYKVFNNSKLDSSKSKYYTHKSRMGEESKIISYYFHVPKSKEIIRSEGKFLYVVYESKKKEEKIDDECKCISSGNQYRCEISIPYKNSIIITGVFWELSQHKDGKMGGSEIYVQDTLK